MIVRTAFEGLVVGVRGSVGSDGEFLVEEMMFCDLPEQEPLPKGRVV